MSKVVQNISSACNSEKNEHASWETVLRKHDYVPQSKRTRQRTTNQQIIFRTVDCMNEEKTATVSKAALLTDGRQVKSNKERKVECIAQSRLWRMSCNAQTKQNKRENVLRQREYDGMSNTKQTTSRKHTQNKNRNKRAYSSFRPR